MSGKIGFSKLARVKGVGRQQQQRSVSEGKIFMQDQLDLIETAVCYSDLQALSEQRRFQEDYHQVI